MVRPSTYPRWRSRWKNGPKLTGDGRDDDGLFDGVILESKVRKQSRGGGPACCASTASGHATTRSARRRARRKGHFLSVRPVCTLCVAPVAPSVKLPSCLGLSCGELLLCGTV